MNAAHWEQMRPRWAVAGVAGFFGVLIWVLSPAIAGVVEPWDAAAPYYAVALSLAGFVSGWLAGRPLWAQYLGVVAGQFLYGLAVLSFGPLILLGVSFLALYALLFLAGVFVGLKARDSLSAQGRRARLSVAPRDATPAWLARYDGQSTEQLIALQDTHSVDSIALAFEEALQARDAQTLSADEAAVIAAVSFARQTSEGGLAKFLRTTPTPVLHKVVAALYTFDCPKAAIVCQDALDAVGSIDSPWRIEQALSNDGVQRRLADCDALLQASDELITRQVLRWIEDHPGKIRL